MFIDSTFVPKNLTVSADICIVGSGAAGLSLALEFLNTEHQVCILESGSAVLNDLEATGLPVSNQSRVRGFGGTTKTWLGIWKPLEPADFESWPVSFSDLEPYYERAANRFSAPHLADFATDLDFFGSESIAPTVFYRLKQPDLDFGKKFRKAFAGSPNTSVYLGANVTKLVGSASQIQEAEVRTLSGNGFQVQAKTFVLAAGGIENPRLMLLSNLGNDNVGRYYMDHPKGVAGIIKTPSAKLKQFYFAAKDKWVGLVLTAKARAERPLLNSHILLEPVRTRFLKRVTSVRIRNFMEQTPDRENRVTLSDQKDALGLPKARVQWQIDQNSQRSLRQFHAILKEELQRLGLGILESPLLEDNQNFSVTKDASHHMGTTRMGKDSATSVVGENCRVHGTKNLYIAGSSVFPTSGYANPTATITALAIRLADYLKSLFTSPHPSPISERDKG